MVTDAYHEHVRELLASVPGLGFRRMFGGLGVYREGRIFALAVDDQLYLKTDPESRPAFETAGASPFAYDAKAGRVVTNYWRLPSPAEDDPEEAGRWAGTALEAAARGSRPQRGRAAAYALGPGPWDG